MDCYKIFLDFVEYGAWLVWFKPLNFKNIREKYPYPQCLVTPVIILLLIIFAAMPRGEDLKKLVLNTKLQIFQASGGSVFDDVVTEDSWGSFEVFLSVDKDNEITFVHYLSFPSWSITYVETTETYSVPPSILKSVGIT